MQAVCMDGYMDTMVHNQMGTWIHSQWVCGYMDTQLGGYCQMDRTLDKQIHYQMNTTIQE